MPLSIPADWYVVERSLGYQLYPHRVRGEGLSLAAFRQKADHRSRRKALPFRKLKRVGSKERDVIQEWVRESAEITWYSTPQERWRGIYSDHLADTQVLASVLSRLEVGAYAGHFKGKNWIPSPEWVLHNWCNPHLPSIALDRTTAISYLRKETPPLPDLLKGWAAVTYEGLNLGWIKGLGHRCNNYYPKHWRIRMQEKNNPVNVLDGAIC